MAEPVSDDSLTAIVDTSDRQHAAARLSSNTKLSKILFNDEVQKAIEQVGAVYILFVCVCVWVRFCFIFPI